ncbi:RING finger protein nhl-1-like [Mytilus californianus]|uniref:RING finger protein nhl-1-like n=1 Tax=Mytilus californianus TaxID=6549 RepID=UPI002245B230|nr:RING finger protein nhl-1-like [Mytilus californianus]XP_052103206.1 RING finger protein nhl-1-like [Mytilus californianus]XP_052103207.1 RING finger protein nhl-1-like [Mytilus californianus]
MATAGEDQTDNGPKRSLIVDEAAFEEQFLRCHICNEKYSQSDRLPKSLPCNHTFCLTCLKSVFDHHHQNSRRTVPWMDDNLEGVLKCPECRVEIFLSRTEISALPSDHRVIQMMDFLSRVTTKSQNVCSKHENQPLNFFCKKCLIPVCRDCTVLDHKEGQEHVIVDVTEALSENSNEFDEMNDKNKGMLDKMKGRTDSLANASKQLDLLERKLRSTIKDTFIEYRLLLERRQEALIKILRESVQEQKQKINTRFVDICTQGSQLQKLYDTFTKARSNNDIRQLFTVQQQLKEKETEFTCTAEATDDELFITCKFEAPNECLFLSEMSGLGEVTTIEDLSLKNPVPAHQLVLLDSLDSHRLNPALYLPELDCDENESPDNENDIEHNDDDSNILPDDISSNIRNRLLQGSENDQQTDENDDHYLEQLREHREQLASTYLMRIASRLNESAAEMAEALNQQPTQPDPRTPSQSSQSSRGSNNRSSSSRQRRPQQPVRVVRHPTQPTPPREARDQGGMYTSSRYTNSDNR